MRVITWKERWLDGMHDLSASGLHCGDYGMRDRAPKCVQEPVVSLVTTTPRTARNRARMPGNL